VKDNEAKLGYLQTKSSLQRYARQIAKFILLMQRTSYKKKYRPFYTKDLRTAVSKFNDWVSQNIFTKEDPPKGKEPVDQLFILLSEVFYREFELSEDFAANLKGSRDIVQLFLTYDAIDDQNCIKSPKVMSRQVPPLMMAGRYVILYDIMTNPDLLKEWAKDEL
jgi:hypothetical protein